MLDSLIIKFIKITIKCYNKNINNIVQVINKI